MTARLLLGCCIAISLFASDPKWTKKDYTAWSTADAQQVLTDSAWAKHVDAFIGTTDEDPRTYPAKGLGPRDIGMGGRSNSDDWFPVGKLPATGMPTLPVTVRWESALPVREALLRSGQNQDTGNTLAVPEKYYIITVLGLATARKPDSEDAGQFDQTRLRQGLLNQARLMVRGKPTIVPEDARIDEKTGAIRIYFPKTESITLDDKEVTFGTIFGSVRVIQRFRLKDMVYKGKLQL